MIDMQEISTAVKFQRFQDNLVRLAKWNGTRSHKSAFQVHLKKRLIFSIPGHRQTPKPCTYSAVCSPHPLPLILPFELSTSLKSKNNNKLMTQLKPYSMLPSFRTGPVFVQKELYLIIFVGHLNLRQPKNSKSKRNISAINCQFCRAF